ncbi:hypothetical protein LX64_02663 [Chitinophaga skermanii]|uniref:Uncharacterized protein n=1 Tax=Chitinophaga skermanii TaxID=331697 RepID=A0A327QP73_9BACT|nr:hypothetical protein LX64_02663 [Chitinophaga skermanii]
MHLFLNLKPLGKSLKKQPINAKMEYRISVGYVLQFGHHKQCRQYMYKWHCLREVSILFMSYYIKTLHFSIFKL